MAKFWKMERRNDAKPWEYANINFAWGIQLFAEFQCGAQAGLLEEDEAMPL